ncbi:MAG: hypothetical protein ABSH51_08980 [Solirubrobacteraceae bacterium]|jgi:hypothetical protein
MKTVLVVANETIGGRPLLEAVRRHAHAEETRFVLCVPQTRPRAGYVIYDDAVFDAAQARVDLAVGFVRAEGMEAVGEVGDPDPYAATMDAVREYDPDAIIISTYPEARSGWLRRDLIERIRQASGLPVEHVVADIDSEGLSFHITLAVANRTASGNELLEALKAKAQHDAASQTDRRVRMFIVVVPQEGGDGSATRRARTRLALVLRRLRDEGLTAAGMVGDPDPYTAIMNALQYFRVDDIVISTFAETKSGWMRADLVDRVRSASGKEVDHVVHLDPVRASA